jgi:hypothetical protein
MEIVMPNGCAIGQTARILPVTVHENAGFGCPCATYTLMVGAINSGGMVADACHAYARSLLGMNRSEVDQAQDRSMQCCLSTRIAKAIRLPGFTMITNGDRVTRRARTIVDDGSEKNRGA